MSNDKKKYYLARLMLITPLLLSSVMLSFVIEELHQKNLQQQYLCDSIFSEIAWISQLNYFQHQEQEMISIASTVRDVDAAFAIHSISKVFTVVLLFILVQEGILKRELLDQPLLINPYIKTLLPAPVVEQLGKTTMHQIMTHSAGFGDYTVNYCTALEKSLQDNEPIPLIQQTKDFLPYADSVIVHLDTGETHYSNLGFLLLGLSIEYHYNNSLSERDAYFSFDEILHEYIIQPAGMKLFSYYKPHNAGWNESGSCAAYICASPAGGHWTTVRDLQKFGSWLYKKYHTDTEFKKLLGMYGYHAITL